MSTVDIEPTQRKKSSPRTTLPIEEFAARGAASPGEYDPMFAPLWVEHDYYIDDTEGELPEGLRGTLYRNNGGKFEAGGERVGAFTDGEGMLAMYAIDDGKVRFRNRYVRTTHFTADKSVRGFGTSREGGVLANVMRLPASRGNTNAVLHHGELLAMYETDKPYVLDPNTLDTRGKSDFHGKLGSPIWIGTFSAHPKTDAETGELFNFGFEMLPRPMLKCYKISRSGVLSHVDDVHLPHALWNHDFALTKRYMVFVLDPLVIEMSSIAKFALGLTGFDQSIKFKPGEGTTIVLVARDGSGSRVIQTDAMFHFHVINAYDQGRDVVVELCEWLEPWNDVLRGFKDYDKHPETGWNTGGIVTRVTATSDGKVRRERVSETPGEWPQFDWRRCCLDYRYTYMAARDDHNISHNTVVKVDSVTGQEWVHRFPDGHHASEAVFVARSKDADEDDGWLLTQVYDPDTHRSRLVVLDAKEPERDPLFVGHLKHHIPWSYHGSFSQHVARPGKIEPPRDIRLAA